MQKPQDTPPSKPAAPAAASAAAEPMEIVEQQPQAGGSYTRLPDGTLVPNTTNPTPE